MGCGSSLNRTSEAKDGQTAPVRSAENFGAFPIVPGAHGLSIAPEHTNGQPLLFSQRVPNAWQVQEVLSRDEVNARWSKFASREESSVPAAPRPDKKIKRAPMKVALNVMPTWDETDFDLHPGSMIMGRYKVQAAAMESSDCFEVIDMEDGSACVLQVQTATPVAAILQALAKHEAVRKSSASHHFLLYKDVILSPDSGHWAVIVEQQRSTLRNHVLSSGESLIGQLGQIASAVLKALVHLHAGCWVHADVSLDNIVCGADGRWKLAGLDRANAQPKGGGGVVPRISAPGRLRPPEVLLGFPSDEKSDVFDLGIALLEAALGEQLMEVQAAPSLFEEFDHIIRRFGPIPQALWNRSPCKESIGLPDGNFLKPAKRGAKDIIEALSPGAPPLNGGTFSADLQQGRMSGQSTLFEECRNFLKKLLSLDPKDRYSVAEALADNFLKHLADEGKMKRVSLARQPETPGQTVIEVLDDEEIEQLLMEGEDELALLNQGVSAEIDVPIDTKRRLSTAKIDVAGVPGKSQTRKTAYYSEKANEVRTFDHTRGSTQSALTMLPGTVEEQSERHAHVDEALGAHDVHKKIMRQQTGFARNGNVGADVYDDEGTPHVKVVASEPKSGHIHRQKTGFVHNTAVDDETDEDEEEKHVTILESIDNGHVSKPILRQKTGFPVFARQCDVEGDEDEED